MCRGRRRRPELPEMKRRPCVVVAAVEMGEKGAENTASAVGELFEVKEAPAPADGTPSQDLLVNGMSSEEKQEEEAEAKPQSDEEEKKPPSEEKEAASPPPSSEEVSPPSDEETKTPLSNLERKMPPSEEKPPAKVRPRRGDSYTLGVPDPDATLFCNVALMAFASLLYAGMAPWLLRRVAGQPTDIVWTVYLLAGSYMSLWTVILSRTMDFLTVFLRTTYVLLLALSAAQYFGPVSGAAIASLGICFSTGMLGYAVGEHLLSAGTEKAATLAVSHNIRSIEEENRRKELSFSTLFMQILLTVCVLQRMVWVMLRSTSDNHSITFVFEEVWLETVLLTWLWSDYVALILLEEALVSVHTMLIKGPACAFMGYILSVVVSITAGKAIGILFLSPIPIGMSGFLGYCLAVYASYKEIRARARVCINNSFPLPQKMVMLHRSKSA